MQSHNNVCASSIYDSVNVMLQVLERLLFAKIKRKCL